MEKVELQDLQIGEMYEVDCGDSGLEFFHGSRGHSSNVLFGKQTFMYLSHEINEDYKYYYDYDVLLVDLSVVIGDIKGHFEIKLADPQNEIGGSVRVITKAK